MGMWVRSQNKEVITNTNTIMLFNNFIGIDGSYIVARNGDEEILLGEYSTKEKALKVLDRIQDYIDEPIYANYTDSEYVHYDKEVFQVPQDDEVEI